MLPGVWYYLANPAMSLTVAALMLAILIRCNYHLTPEGAISRQRIATVVLLSASTYTFGVAALAELIFHAPNLSTIFRDGFGDGRVAWLLLGVVIEATVRLWDEYRPA